MNEENKIIPPQNGSNGAVELVPISSRLPTWELSPREPHLYDYLLILRKHQWLILSFMLAVVTIVAVATLKGLRWKRNQFCRGWLITGDTGSGKTSSGINQLAHQVFQNEPKWGGLCVDEKGVYWETLAAMARHYEDRKSVV